MADHSDKRRRRPTQADVARQAGVSQATVSQVLNNNMAIAVPEETRRRVMAAIDALGYVHDRTARSLRTRKTYTIASIIPDITNPFYPAFERGLQDVADRHSYDLITYNTDGVAEKERRCLRSVQQGRVDGVVVVLFHLAARDLLPLLDMSIAVVRLEATPKRAGERPLDNLCVDNAAAARQAIEHLIGLGHRRIGVIAARFGPGQPRLAGYREALAHHGIEIDPQLIRNGDFTLESGRRCAAELLALTPRPTALFAANDMMALGALGAARDAGLRVPDDVALVGFDDIPPAALVSPPLTTVRLFQERLGQRAAEMLMERLDGGAPPHGRSEMLPFELVIRESA